MAALGAWFFSHVMTLLRFQARALTVTLFVPMALHARARLHFCKQARVLEDDHGLIGNRGQAFDVAERSDLASAQREHPEQGVIPEQWHAFDRTPAGFPRLGAEPVFRLGKDVGDL